MEFKKEKAPFNVKYQKNLFFKLAGISESKMSIVQVQEMTKTFYAGFGNCLIMMKNEIPKLEEMEAVEKMQNMLIECEEFWKERMTEAGHPYEEI